MVRAKETHFSNQMQQENDVFGSGIGVPQSANGGGAGGIVASGNVNGMINGAEGKLRFRKFHKYMLLHRASIEWSQA